MRRARARRCATLGLRARPPPTPTTVTFLNGRDSDISIWWTHFIPCMAKSKFMLLKKLFISSDAVGFDQLPCALLCRCGGFLLPGAPQPGQEVFDDLLVGRGERGWLGHRGRPGLFFDVLQDVEQHFGGAQIGRGGFVDQLSDHRFALGDLAAASVLGDGDRLVQRRGRQRRQVFRMPAAGINRAWCPTYASPLLRC